MNHQIEIPEEIDARVELGNNILNSIITGANR